MSTSEPEPKALRYSRPRSRRDWKFFVRLIAIPVLALAGIAGMLVEEHHFKVRTQTSWTTINATVEDTRTRPIARFALEYGGTKMYEVDVLASFTLNGNQQTAWLPISEPPKLLADANSEAETLKGKHCFVHWDPSSPDEKLVSLR